MNLVQKSETAEAAASLGLRFVSSDKPGITRKKRGKGFVYYGPDDKQIKDEATLERIRSLVIPPAWNPCWICPTANGYLQAVGRDAKRRKQYLYHPRYRETRNLKKYDRLLPFASRPVSAITDTATTRSMTPWTSLRSHSPSDHFVNRSLSRMVWCAIASAKCSPQ